MVCMFVGENDGVKPVYRMTQHLLSEIGATVDHYIAAFRLNQHGDSQAFIPGVLT